MFSITEAQAWSVEGDLGGADVVLEAKVTPQSNRSEVVLNCMIRGYSFKKSTTLLGRPELMRGLAFIRDNLPELQAEVIEKIAGAKNQNGDYYQIEKLPVIFTELRQKLPI